MKFSRQSYKIIAAWMHLLLFIFPMVSKDVHTLSLTDCLHHEIHTDQSQNLGISCKQQSCLICDYHFVSFIAIDENNSAEIPFIYSAHSVQSTSDKQSQLIRLFGLRAPPFYC
ncbi:MAG: hypothetical protein ACK5MI_00705 [Mangrovibacterium sp.]